MTALTTPISARDLARRARREARLRHISLATAVDVVLARRLGRRWRQRPDAALVRRAVICRAV